MTVARFRVLVALLGALLAGVVSGAVAQEPATLAELEEAYRAAKASHEAALLAFQAVWNDFDEATGVLLRARSSDDEAAIQEAFGPANALAGELRRLGSRVDSTRARFDVSLQAYMDAIAEQRDSLTVAELEASPEQARFLAARITDLDNTYRELQIERAEGPRVDAQPVLPALTLDPRDDNQDIRAKARLSQARASLLDAEIERVDGEIGQLEERIRLQRRRESSRASRNRFDGAVLPIIPDDGDGGGGENSVAGEDVPFHERPPEEQLASLREYRAEVLRLRDEFLERAAFFTGLISQEGPR